jgi:hypothetical protein
MKYLAGSNSKSGFSTILLCVEREVTFVLYPMKKSSSTSKGLYQWTRKLHLYFGMFICPFILVYAVSTIYLNHSVRPKPVDEAQAPVSIQVDRDAKGPELVNQVLEQLELTGEIVGRGQVNNNRTIIRVARPGSIKVVTVDLVEQQATILERSNGLLGAINYLHFNPGLHRIPNWGITKLWGWLADTVVYVTLFLTVSGIYLWALIKSERKIGWILLGGGFGFFISIVAALVYI